MRHAELAPSQRKTPMSQKKKRKRGPKWLQRLQLNATVFSASALVWLLRLTCRIEVVSGNAHVDEALARGVVAPCSWHQQIVGSGLFLRSLIPRGLKTGFLISPSREGEFMARVATHHKTQVMRGSSSRTGREAIEAIIKGTEQGISPMIYADGPRGPAHVFKPGAVILSQRTGTPIMAVGSATSRYWQINSWDKNHIPKPFARITIAVGKLTIVPSDEEQLDDIAQQVGYTIDELTRVAEAAQK